VPILRYHVVGIPSPRQPYAYLFVAPQAFAAQLRYLATHGYHAVTLRQVAEFWHGRGRLPAHPIVLTFDDGYRSDFATVAPLLRELRWPAVLYQCLRFLGPNLPPPYSHRQVANGALTVPEIRALIHSGWEIDAHTMTHPDLCRVSAARLWAEVAGSRAALQRLFGVPVDFFCYPRGLFDSAAIAAVRRAGFLGATTCDAGLATPAMTYTEDRIGVEGGETLAAFARSLQTGFGTGTGE
jgi:peptidoglycan/xylan/chitin deacetylase (PgdA/CDA1 family)